MYIMVKCIFTMTNRHEELLAAYFADQLTDDERREFLSLLETDSEFADNFRKMEEAYVWANIPTFEKAKDKNFRILLRRIQGPRRISSLWKYCAVAVSAAAIALLGVFLYPQDASHDGECYLNQSDIMTVTAKNGTGTEALLPDGTRVCLNAESTLSFNRHFGTDCREVTLEGEAYFEVTTDESRPFRVHAGNTCVTVKGTTFNVRSYEDEPQITVSLLEGSVVLNTSVEEATLTPGTCAVVSRSNDDITTGVADPYASDWVKGKLVFTDKSIPEILRYVERNYGVRFVYVADLFGVERFTGNISFSLSIDEILSYLDVDKKYRWKRLDDTIEIYKK